MYQRVYQFLTKNIKLSMKFRLRHNFSTALALINLTDNRQALDEGPANMTH